MICLGLITTILIIVHIVMTLKWDLWDPAKTRRVMWLAIAIAVLRAVAGDGFVIIMMWVVVAAIYGILTYTE